jgi:PAS domain S-box-containing protein
MFFVGEHGAIQTWNPGAENVLGYAASEAVTRNLADLYRQVDRAAGIPEADLRTAAASGSVRDHRWLVRNDGSEFWAEGSLTAVRDSGGELAGYACIFRDASERRRLEQALERTNEELQRFVFTVSHDLKEPLRTTGTYSELLARRYKGKLDADADEFIRFIVDGVARMGQLLGDIVAYSHAGRQDRTRPEATQSANVLQWALMNLDGLAKQTGAVITHDALPTVLADQTQLSNVFQHLLGNSIKFRGQEAPRVHVSAQQISRKQWEFSVRDNGIGVASDQTERVFGVFKRLHGREMPGTGIGLAICRKIIDAHGGRIWMESEPGKGTIVRFTLPAA